VAECYQGFKHRPSPGSVQTQLLSKDQAEEYSEDLRSLLHARNPSYEEFTVTLFKNAQLAHNTLNCEGDRVDKLASSALETAAIDINKHFMSKNYRGPEFLKAA